MLSRLLRLRANTKKLLCQGYGSRHRPKHRRITSLRHSTSLSLLPHLSLQTSKVRYYLENISSKSYRDQDMTDDSPLSPVDLLLGNWTV